MRLTEARFKPLFFRLLEWARRPPAEDEAEAVAAATARASALFAAINALSERLRSVFSPYYRPMLEQAVAALGFATTAPPKKKKAKREVAVAGYGEEAWRLRVRALRALQRGLAYDGAALVDDASFEALLPGMAARLAEPAPEELLLALRNDPAEEVLGALGPGPQLESASEARPDTGDAHGVAVIGCLSALAAAAGDARARRVSHEALMATRSSDLRVRLLALAAVAGVAAALGDEFLPLLPEALPFLAESLEDPDQVVEARAAAVLRGLEELSGESLEQYLKA
jgi:U3 small nucleolar RNA-associated protein 10